MARHANPPVPTSWQRPDVAPLPQEPTGGPQRPFCKNPSVISPMDDFHRFVGATQKDAMFPHDLADAHTMDGFERGEKGMQVFRGAAGGVDFVAVVGLYEYPLPVGGRWRRFLSGRGGGFP